MGPVRPVPEVGCLGGRRDTHGSLSELPVLTLRTPARLVERPRGIQSVVARQAAEVL